MPAQILPMIDEAQQQEQQMRMQNMQQQAVYQQQLLDIDKAKFQMEQQLHPVRMAAMQGEAAQRKQASDQAAWAFAHQQEMQPVADAKAKAGLDEAGMLNQLLTGQLKDQPRQIADTTESNRQANKKGRQELGDEAPTGQLAIDVNYKRQTMKIAQDNHMAQLDSEHLQQAASRAAQLSAIMFAPVASRPIMARAYKDHAVFNQDELDAAINAPTDMKNTLQDVSSVLGPKDAQALETNQHIWANAHTNALDAATYQGMKKDPPEVVAKRNVESILERFFAAKEAQAKGKTGAPPIPRGADGTYDPSKLMPDGLYVAPELDTNKKPTGKMRNYKYDAKSGLFNPA